MLAPLQKWYTILGKGQKYKSLGCSLKSANKIVLNEFLNFELDVHEKGWEARE